MKKLFYLLFLLPFSLLTSCDKDDFQPFDMTLTLSGVTQYDGNFYVVAGDNVTIENVSVKTLGDKATAITNVMFYVDNVPLYNVPWSPAVPATFSTSNLPAGRHTIQVAGNLLQVDQSIQDFIATYSLIIVDSSENLPEGAPELGSYSQTITFNN